MENMTNGMTMSVSFPSSSILSLIFVLATLGIVVLHEIGKDDARRVVLGVVSR